MPTLPQTEPASRPKNRSKSIQLFPSDELADLATFALTNEQIGVLMKLRLCCWHRGGLPNTEESLSKTRKQLLGISPRKWMKFWPILSVFFTEIDGFLFFSADESRRQEQLEHSSKLQAAGKKGAESRWNNKHNVSETDDGQAILSEMAPYPSLPIPTPQEAGSSNVDLPPATNQQQPAGEIDRNIESLQTAVGEQWHVLVNRAVQLGLQAPDKATAIRILKKFPDIPPDSFPLLPGQKSSALWLHKEPMDLELEIRRQRETSRRPVQMTRLDQIMEKFVNGE